MILPGFFPAVTTAVAGRKGRAAGSLALRRAVCTSTRPGQMGTTGVPLDGTARGSGHTRALARGAEAAPPLPPRLPLVAATAAVSLDAALRRN